MLTLRLNPTSSVAFTIPRQTTIPQIQRRTLFSFPRLFADSRREQHRSRDPQTGLKTPVPDGSADKKSASPFYFAAGYAGWAKRPSRPFPPPFFSPPSGSFSDPLSTTHRSMDRRPKVDGQMIRGVTNGDDAMLVSETLIATNDGVGAWATRERGCAPLWSRLIAHFMALSAEKALYAGGEDGEPEPVKWLEEAYEHTKAALSEPNEWHGTTTTSAALLHWKDDKPLVYVTQLGDCKVLVVRPQESGEGEVLFSSVEQYHYFDCPRQLGTNSPDTPEGNAVLDKVDVEEDDVVLALSDGVTDNLWEEEISDYAAGALKTIKEKHGHDFDLQQAMKYVAQEIVLAARKIAEDPFAASPFMEKAVEEGLAIEGGKPDDISVVAAICKRRKG
ncbi:unnamed protein product [Zymoseptoria tritici ST99CH_3D7]|uniref:Protein phosphatase n=1 Tax=Zymoseptoria tritici (strain ST99CH_3D7) TaxID=1276538 RepID=A0A1X7RTQ2_ZYMT9|nr:unnamed protein product [Zymoseptoria tritici ST99CH_3D7]